jgi:hypothetical protein
VKNLGVYDRVADAFLGVERRKLRAQLICKQLHNILRWIGGLGSVGREKTRVKWMILLKVSPACVPTLSRSVPYNARKFVFAHR